MVMRSCDIDAAKERAKKGESEPVIKKEEEMNMEEWILYKLAQWERGEVYCQEQDKGKIVRYLYDKIKNLENKRKEV